VGFNSTGDQATVTGYNPHLGETVSPVSRGGASRELRHGGGGYRGCVATRIRWGGQGWPREHTGGGLVMARW
jgi:hypothetical protein